MPVNWTTTDDIAAQGGIKCLVYGRSGLGKTLLCATLPRPIILSAESGLLSLRRENIVRVFGENAPGITYSTIPVAQIKTVDDLTEMYNYCVTYPDSYDSVALDSLSEIGEVVLNNAKRQVKDPRQAYGELIEKMENVIRLFRDLPGKNVYMAAKEEPIKDELTGIMKYGPSMPGKQLAIKLPYFFDEVFRLGVNKDQQGKEFRFIQTSPDMQYEAKDRSGALAPMEVPHLGYLFSKILGA